MSENDRGRYIENRNGKIATAKLVCLNTKQMLTSAKCGGLAEKSGDPL